MGQKGIGPVSQLLHRGLVIVSLCHFSNSRSRNGENGKHCQPHVNVQKTTQPSRGLCLSQNLSSPAWAFLCLWARSLPGERVTGNRYSECRPQGKEDSGHTGHDIILVAEALRTPMMPSAPQGHLGLSCRDHRWLQFFM